MLVSDRDDLAVIGGDLVEVRDPLEERRSVRHCRAGPVLGQCEDRDRPPGCGERVDAFVAPFHGQVDPGVSGDASASGQHQPG